MEKERAFKIYGKILEKESKKGIPGLIVEALDRDFCFDDRLGSVITNKEGNFEIVYGKEDFQELFFDQKPDIYLRIRRSDGKIIHTTEDKVRYEAGETEEFILQISKKLIEEEEEMKKVNYKIEGKIDPKILKEVPEELKLKIYAVRDRKVIGSSLIEEDGSFNIEYEYDIYEKDEKRLAIGSYLVAGPEMPEDGILKEKFPKIFLKSNKFKEKERKFYASVSSEVIDKIVNKDIIYKLWKPWWQVYCYKWRPCVEPRICSRIEDGLCYGERPLLSAHVRIYEVRRSFFPFPGGHKYTVLVAEGDVDEYGYFKTEKTICRHPYIILLYWKLGYRVEVGQIIDGVFNSVYMDPEDQLRELKNDLCEEVYIDENDVEEPQEAEGEMTGNTFKLTRIGNIPVEYIEQDPASLFYGYANTMTATDSATLKVYDSAFCRTIKLFANIGSGLLSGTNAVKYYRIKYSYKSSGTTVEKYIEIPFKNLRESTEAEEPVSGPYITEYMGPIDGPDGKRNVYTYPNPYDFTVDKQWVYKGLIIVFNTLTLPLYYGKFTFTVEPLKADMSSVTVDNSDELSCTILVDNTAPIASIGNIEGPYNEAPACGFLELDGYPVNTYKACDGNTRKQLNGTVTVPYTVDDTHRNIYQIKVIADYGDVCDPNITMQTLDYTDTAIVPLANRPHWRGGSYSASSSGKQTANGTINKWDQCAYQFSVRVHKRVTNGECGYYWWDFTKHITIMEKEQEK